MLSVGCWVLGVPTEQRTAVDMYGIPCNRHRKVLENDRREQRLHSPTTLQGNVILLFCCDFSNHERSDSESVHFQPLMIAYFKSLSSLSWLSIFIFDFQT